jgi:sulfatase maturation enzyme AslB (radical SAM superfamily)
MKLEEIGFYTLSDFRAKSSNSKSPLWRCELILTDKCNLNCIYCRGLEEKNSGSLSFGNAKNIVQMWADSGLKNIRFSGGEPTLWAGLPLLCNIARRQGIKRVAVSTNGTAPLDLYKNLVNLGVNDFSISLDACCSSTAKTMSGGKEIWKKLTKNINEIANLTYTTVGIVLTEKNISEAEKIISFASTSLNVSDIRIIPAAQEAKTLKKISIDNDILNRHPILKYRIYNSSVGKSIRGIEKTDFAHCPLVLDDMVIVKNYHYPCIIYLRERGEPIGKISDMNIERIRNQRHYWYINHNTYKDPICRNNCLDVCVDYNNKWYDFHKSEAIKNLGVIDIQK